MISRAEWLSEKEWLMKVLKVIEVQLSESEKQNQSFQKKVLSANRSMWEDISSLSGKFEDDFDIIIEMNQYQKERKIQILNQRFYANLVRRYKKMYQTPYFARLDFLEDGKDEVENLYIGLATLFDKNDNCLVYDWRAPISSMFYDYQPGRAEYETKLGPIQGELMRKRQYRIQNGEIQLMFDTNIKIDDEILQEILSRNASGKMKQIVTSIQKEQNKVIRDDEHKLLIVQGAAGSGKTSIALHRIAFLLYKHRNTVNSDNILIFSPNSIFSDYISNVLPELGEENMRQYTFQEYAEEVLGDNLQIEDIYSQFEFFLSKPEPDSDNQREYQNRLSGARYKASSDFVQVIKNYIQLIEKKKIQFEDFICAGEMIISREELERIWSNINYLPFAKALGKIQRRFVYRLKPFKKRRFWQLLNRLGKMPGYTRVQKVRLCMTKLRNETRPLKEKLRQILSYDILEMYCELFRDRELFLKVANNTQIPENFDRVCVQTLNSLSKGIIQHEDVAPLLYFKEALEGQSTINRGIKYVLIDEAQDYSPFQYEIIHQLFPKSNLTLLGDMNQSIYFHMGIKNYEQIAEIIDVESAKMINLKNSYRSTAEITNFTKALLGQDQGINAVNRPGEKPEIIKISNSEMVDEILLGGIQKFKEKGAESMAIICKTAALSEKVYHMLKDKTEISLITKEDKTFTRDSLVVIPSYLAKGLEFDGVLVYSDEENNYLCKEEINLLYTVCTRALHYLSIYYSGERFRL